MSLRCPHCAHTNPEGTALCEQCDEPLTAYSGTNDGPGAAAARAKLARISQRPPIVPVMIGFHIFMAVFVAFGRTVSMFLARTTVNTEGTNYIGAAFGGLAVTFAALVFIPAGVFMLVTAWGLHRQSLWAWTANLIVLGLTALLSLMGFFPGLLLKSAALGFCAVSGWFWLQEPVRDWYGQG